MKDPVSGYEDWLLGISYVLHGEFDGLGLRHMAPGFMDNGVDDPYGETVIDEYGTRWSPVVRTHDSDW